MIRLRPVESSPVREEDLLRPEEIQNELLVVPDVELLDIELREHIERRLRLHDRYAGDLFDRVIDKHVTIDRRMKGTDQAGSLGPDGVNRMIRDIRITEMSMGKEDIFIEPEIQNSKIKLERSIATNHDLKVGDIISENDIHLLSPGDGFKWSERQSVIGKKVKVEIPRNEIIYPQNIE